MENAEQLLEQFKAWVKEEPRIPETTEYRLKSFLHCCDYDLDKAKQTIQNYYTMRANGPEIFQDRDVNNDRMKNILSICNIYVTPKPTPEGYKVLIMRLIDTDPKKYDMVAQMKYLLMSLETMLFDDTLLPGHVIVFDVSAISPSHILKFSPSGIKKTSNYLQEALPLHMRAAYLVNASSVVDLLMKTVKPFTNADLFNRIIIYRSADLEKLYEKVPRDCLPEEYGGYLPPSAELNAKNTERLRQLKEQFDKEDAILRTVEGLVEK